MFTLNIYLTLHSYVLTVFLYVSIILFSMHFSLHIYVLFHFVCTLFHLTLIFENPCLDPAFVSTMAVLDDVACCAPVNVSADSNLQVPLSHPRILAQSMFKLGLICILIIISSKHVDSN